MHAIRIVLTGLSLFLMATGGLTQVTPPPKEMRSLRERAPVAKAITPNVQVLDLRTAPAGGEAPLRPPTDPEASAARKAEPEVARSLAANELGAALRGAQIALATQNVYATVTPGHLFADGRAITRVGQGIYRIEPNLLVLSFDQGGGIDVELMLRDSGVYLVDYTYTYSGAGSAFCVIEHREIAQVARLTPWHNGDEASHIIAAVNYVAPATWPTFQSGFGAVDFWCDSDERNESLMLYSINIVKP